MRRELFQRVGCGLGGFALAELLRDDLRAGTDAAGRCDPLAVRPPHFRPRAKSVIYIHLVGAPSHLDLFDAKPELQKHHGEPCPEELFEGKQFAFIRSRPRMLGTPKLRRFRLRRCGESGATISDLMPHLQKVADELCFIKSLHTNEFNHGPAQMLLLSGFARFGRPSIGSWVTYGLGTENRNLPGFVVLITGLVLGAGSPAWGSGFLPTVYQGIEFRSQGDPVLFLSNPRGVDRETRRRVIDTTRQLNQAALADVGDPEIATRIDQYEMAFRMQSSVPELMSIDGEPPEIHAMYGTQPGKTSFANNCLLARRLVERGVRFVQLFDQGWDMHNGLLTRLPKKCKEVDRPIAALIRDLKQRGLLDETLVVWSSEFGRTPMAQGKNSLGISAAVGRDHHRDAYTVWLAGGGVTPGCSYGATDDIGYSIAENPVHVHDLNATILHLLGLDHERLTFRYQGRQYRLTDIHGNVVHDIISNNAAES